VVDDPVSLEGVGALHLLSAMVGNRSIIWRRPGRRRSWIWVALMSINLAAWKRDNPAGPCAACSPMSRSICGLDPVARARDIFQILRWRSAARHHRCGLARVFFSWTLHAIVYFWLMPTYIAYNHLPRAIGGALQRSMARISFILFLVCDAIGVHHLFTDPQSRRFNSCIRFTSLWRCRPCSRSSPSAPRPNRSRCAAHGAFGWVNSLPLEKFDHAPPALSCDLDSRRRRRSYELSLDASSTIPSGYRHFIESSARYL